LPTIAESTIVAAGRHHPVDRVARHDDVFQMDVAVAADTVGAARDRPGALDAARRAAIDAVGTGA